MCVCVCVLPVSEAAGSQVRELTVLQSTFNKLIQSVVKERLMLSVHILYTLTDHTHTESGCIIASFISTSHNKNSQKYKQITWVGSSLKSLRMCVCARVYL